MSEHMASLNWSQQGST